MSAANHILNSGGVEKESFLDFLKIPVEVIPGKESYVSGDQSGEYKNKVTCILKQAF